MARIEWVSDARPRFFPFLLDGSEEEPKSIMIQPHIAFGRPVLAGTGIAAEVVAGRFMHRESLTALAEEYGVPATSIEEAIRWEFPLPDAA